MSVGKRYTNCELCGRLLAHNNDIGVCDKCRKEIGCSKLGRPRPQETKRQCLMCDKWFKSEGRGNRICASCKKSAVYRQTQEPMARIYGRKIT